MIFVIRLISQCRIVFGQRFPRIRFLALICLLTGSISLAQKPANDPPQKKAVPQSGVWLYSDSSGHVAGGMFTKIHSEGFDWRDSEDQKIRTIDWSKVEEIRRNSDSAVDPVTDPALGSMLLLPEGDRLRGEGVALLEKGLAVQSASLGVLNLPAAYWSGAIFQAPKQASEFLRLYHRLRQGASKPGDLVVLGNGDQLSGTLVELDGETLQIQPTGATKAAKLKRSDLIAVGIDPKSSVYPKSTTRLWEVHLNDGSRLSATALTLEEIESESVLMLTTRWGAVWKCPTSKITRFRVVQPSQIDLEKKPADAIQTVDYVGKTSLPKFGSNVQGGPLKLGARFYDKGIGTQARTLMAYRLEGTETEFTAWLGVDSSAGPLGRAKAVVLVDGKPVYESGPMKAGEPPRRITLKLSQARLLILSSEFGEGGGVRDWVDWCEPTLK